MKYEIIFVCFSTKLFWFRLFSISIGSLLRLNQMGPDDAMTTERECTAFLFSARQKSPSFRALMKNIFLMYYNVYNLPEWLWRQNRAYRNVLSITGGTGTDSKRPHAPVRHWWSGIRNWLHWNTRQCVRSSTKRTRHRDMYRMGWIRGKFLSKNVLLIYLFFFEG